MRDRRGLEVLKRQDCLLRLGRTGLGRVAVTVGALPAIFPVNYATIDGDIVFRSAPGTKLTAAANNAIVAFEVDEADRMSHTGWSVMVVGPAHVITEPRELGEARTLPLLPWAGGGDDAFVRIESRLVSGRALTSAVDEDEPPRGWPLDVCPSCGSDAIRAVHDGEATNFLCVTCYACWHLALGTVYERPTVTCPGCRVVELCRAAHPLAAPMGPTALTARADGPGRPSGSQGPLVS